MYETFIGDIMLSVDETLKPLGGSKGSDSDNLLTRFVRTVVENCPSNCQHRQPEIWWFSENMKTEINSLFDVLPKDSVHFKGMCGKT